MDLGGRTHVRVFHPEGIRYKRFDYENPEVIWNGVALWHVKDDKYASMWVYNGLPRRRYRIKKQCSACGADVYVPACRDVRKHRSFCNKECKDRVFRGKKRKFKHGGPRDHILVYAPGHPKARNKCVPEHRLVVEKDIGRILRDDEVVHHIDCDKQNNEIGNLVVMSTKEHNVAHGSLNRCVKALMTGGCRLSFNRESLVYEVVYDNWS